MIPSERLDSAIIKLPALKHALGGAHANADVANMAGHQRKAVRGVVASNRKHFKAWLKGLLDEPKEKEWMQADGEKNYEMMQSAEMVLGQIEGLLRQLRGGVAGMALSKEQTQHLEGLLAENMALLEQITDGMP